MKVPRIREYEDKKLIVERARIREYEDKKLIVERARIREHEDRKLIVERASLREHEDRKLIVDVTMQHINMLMHKKINSFTIDDYGSTVIDKNKWRMFIVSFCESTISNDISITKDRIVQIVNETVMEQYTNYPKIVDFNRNITGHEYEQYCSELLSNK